MTEPCIALHLISQIPTTLEGSHRRRYDHSQAIDSAHASARTQIQMGARTRTSLCQWRAPLAGVATHLRARRAAIKRRGAIIAHRKRLVDEWNAWRLRCRDDIADDRRKRGKKADPAKEKQPVEEKEEIEVWVDEVIEQIEEEVLE